MLSAIGLVLCPSSTYIGTVDEQARYMPMTLPYSNTSSMAEKEFKLNLVLNLSTTVKISRNPDQDITLTTTGHSVSISNLSYVDPYGMRSSVNLEGTCAHPEYLVFTWVLCLVSLATALKLYYLVKAIMALGMVAFYTALILFKFSTGDSFSLVQLSTLGVPLGVQMLILLISFLVMVCYHARLVEVSDTNGGNAANLTSRLITHPDSRFPR